MTAAGAAAVHGTVAGNAQQPQYNLPQANDKLASCECGQCMLRPRNITIHNLLHPFNKIDGGDEEQLFTVTDLLRMKKFDRRSAESDTEAPR